MIHGKKDPKFGGLKKPDVVEKTLKELKDKVLYPQDNNTEGFFIAKFRRVK